MYVLHCTVLTYQASTVLYCTTRNVQYCTVLYVLYYSSVLYCTALYSSTKGLLRSTMGL